MSCSECGAKRGHLGGCSQGGSSGSGRSGSRRGHKHNWILKRESVRGKNTFRFYECINPGCPDPDKMEVN